jgi:hypothetical protein
MRILRAVMTVVLIILPVAPLGHKDKEDQGRDERRLVVVKLWCEAAVLESERRNDQMRTQDMRKRAIAWTTF